MKQKFMEKEIKSKVKIDFLYSEIENKINLNGDEINKKPSFNFSKKNIYKKFMLVCLSFFIIVGIVSIIINLNKLVYDYEKGAVASKIVENAQYVPDMDKFLEVNKQLEQVHMRNKRMNSLTTKSKMTNEDFAKLIDECAVFDNYSGAGKYLGYDVYEIKNEIKFVVDKVPVFEQWFRMPNMREDEGYFETPYYENWAYYLEYDEETSYLSITRVCWCTNSSYLDFENKVTIKNYEDGTSFVQYEVMKINYFYNEENKEVVECYGYNVGIDKVKNGVTCNENVNDYYPFEYQYLKNIEDELLIKYHITVAQRYRPEESFDQGGMDIRGLYPYGYLREFLIINYDTYQNIDITRIKQYNENPSGLEFNLTDNNIKLLAENLGIEDSLYNTFSSNVEFMNYICKKIVDDFELKNNWHKIYKESISANKIDKIYGKYYQMDIPISDLSHYASCRGHNLTEIEYTASADIYNLNQFNLDKMYSLSMALRKDDGTIHLLATDYHYLEKINYAGSKEDYYYRLQSDLNLLVDEKSNPIFTLDEPGTYTLTTVLTYNEQGEDIIVFDTLENVLLRTYMGLIIPDYQSLDGTVYSYKVKSTGKVLEITVIEK